MLSSGFCYFSSKVLEQSPDFPSKASLAVIVPRSILSSLAFLLRQWSVYREYKKPFLLM